MHSADAQVSTYRASEQQGPRAAGTPTRRPLGTGQRSVLLVTADDALRALLAEQLRLLRWQVRAAAGGAEMFAALDQDVASTVLVDSWLPDLEVNECVLALAELWPEVDILSIDGTDLGIHSARGVFRGEALHALRAVHGTGVERLVSDQPLQTMPKIASAKHSQLEAASSTQPCGRQVVRTGGIRSIPDAALPAAPHVSAGTSRQEGGTTAPKLEPPPENRVARGGKAASANACSMPELIGADRALQEVSRRVSLVAKRKTTVLVHGPTGTGKELVARALHRLSGRAGDRFIAINCAAIPETLVEAELFGHARGAFTGAVQGRVGRIEAAAGGTLFLDEVGELPLAVQGKLLRFLESGEVQRVGENQAIHVDVRVVAATHRKLGAMAAEGTFRLDLLHRLSVFLIETPGLAGRGGDLDALIAHALGKLAEGDAKKQLSIDARAKLHAHTWPGNVRELEHTVERAWILAGTEDVIDAACIEFGESLL